MSDLAAYSVVNWYEAICLHGLENREKKKKILILKDALPEKNSYGFFYFREGSRALARARARRSPSAFVCEKEKGAGCVQLQNETGSAVSDPRRYGVRLLDVVLMR
jgi:hypothetical protein